MKKNNYITFLFTYLFLFIIGFVFNFNVVNAINLDSNVNGFVKHNGNIYYVILGKVQTGLKAIDGSQYYFDSKGVMQTGYIKSNGYYFDSEGKRVFGKFVTIDGKKYYYGKTSGLIQKIGWYTKEGKKYYLDKTTGEVYIGLKTIDGSQYYFDSKGVMQTGYIKSNGYYFDSEGKRVFGKFVTIDSKKYYYGKTSGLIQKLGWYTKEGKKYYLDKTTGEVYIGLKTIDGSQYYFDSKGVMQTGYIKSNGYYFDSEGKRVFGKFVTIDSKKYYYGKTSGLIQKLGWYTKEGKKYYLDKTTGEVYIGLKTIDGSQYYFDSKGVMQTGYIKSNGYYFDSEGKRVFGKFVTIDSKKYYYGKTSGLIQKLGWYTKEGKKYYLDKTTGEVYIGLKTIDGSQYYFDSKGVMQTGYIKSNGYYFDSEGKRVFGKFVTIDSKKYYYGKTSGLIQKLGWYTKEGKKYYLDKTTGEIYIRLHIIDGKTYFFDDEGILFEGNFRLSDDTNHYHFTNSVMDKGWYYYNGKKYYSDIKTGAMYFGVKVIDGEEFTFDSNGALVEEEQMSGIKTTSEMIAQAKNLVSQNQNDYERVLQLTNSYRSEIGVKALTLDADLSVTATIRAIEMAENNYYSHTRPNGGSCFSILYEYGIDYSIAAENIAKGTEGYFTADVVSEGWKNSSGHYKNMTNSEYSKIGIGKYTYNGYTYWAQLFID